MPSPILPPSLRNVIPKVTDRVCDRFINGIIGFMDLWTQFFEWMYNKDGSITRSFADELCGLDCVGGTGDQTCPTVTLNAEVTVADEEINLVWTGTNMGTGYDWALYRSEIEGSFTNPAIDTGTTDSGVIEYDDVTSLVNGVTYYYKLTVQKSGCPEFEGFDSGTPRVCLAYTLTLVLAKQIGGIGLTVIGENPEDQVPEGATWKIWRSQAANNLGDLIATGVQGEGEPGSCTVNFKRALCYSDDGATDPNTRYYYTFLVNQDPLSDCIDHNLLGNESPEVSGSSPTILLIQDGSGRIGDSFRITFMKIADATNYRLYLKRQDNGDVISLTGNDSWFNIAYQPLPNVPGVPPGSNPTSLCFQTPGVPLNWNTQACGKVNNLTNAFFAKAGRPETFSELLGKVIEIRIVGIIGGVDSNTSPWAPVQVSSSI